MTNTDDVRDHPDYETGYFDRWYGKRARADASPEYTAGFAAAARTQEIFEEAGLTKVAPGLYGKTMTIGKSDE